MDGPLNIQIIEIRVSFPQMSHIPGAELENVPKSTFMKGMLECKKKQLWIPNITKGTHRLLGGMWFF